MSRQIYTYTDLQRLAEYPYWNEIKDFPQVTVSTDMRKSLVGIEEVDRVNGLFRNDKNVKVCDAQTFLQQILPKWMDDETKFYESITLSTFIREQIERCGNNKELRNWLIGCRRNKSRILAAITLLEEANVSIEELSAENDRNVQFLLRAWQYLFENNSALGDVRKRFQMLEQRSEWNRIFRNAFQMDRVESIHTIVFHGFYYITPLQERMMRLLEKVGIRLIFLFPYDERYPYANEIWLRTYSEKNGYPAMSAWKMEKSVRKDAYGEIFEGGKVTVSNKVKLKEYASIVEFVNEIKHVKELGYYVYSPNHRNANAILKDFYPEEYGERKLLAYPIGQFISTLNQLWDEDEQDIILDEEKLFACFASGWLAVDGMAAKPYMQDLMYIMPFFADCTRVREWEHRMEVLEAIQSHAITPMLGELDEDDTIARWQEIMANPLLNFSPFAVSSDRLKIVLKLIRQILTMAKELFGENKAIRVKEHIDKLEAVLKKREISDELYEEEVELVQDIFEKLADPAEFTVKCFPADIASALSLFLSGKFDEGELSATKTNMVAPLHQVDAACIKQKGKIHICMCDVGNMPGGKKEYIWPLTGRLIRSCYERTKNPLLENLIHVMESSGICNRYFMYSALKNEDVELSWISDMGNMPQAPSPYIQLLHEAAGIEITPAKRNTITLKRVEEAPVGKARTRFYDVKRMPVDVPKEARMDYAICPMKYALGYVVERQPTFQNEFHQNYAINGLITAIHSLMKKDGMTADEIYQHVIELFPALRPAEKRQIYDYMVSESSFDEVDFATKSEMGSAYYTEERLKVRFPDKNVRDQAIAEYGRLLTPNGQTGMNFYVTAADMVTDKYKKKKRDVCLFCQHQSYCRYAVFAVDSNLEAEEVLYD